MWIACFEAASVKIRFELYTHATERYSDDANRAVRIKVEVNII